MHACPCPVVQAISFIVPSDPPILGASAENGITAKELRISLQPEQAFSDLGIDTKPSQKQPTKGTQRYKRGVKSLLKPSASILPKLAGASLGLLLPCSGLHRTGLSEVLRFPVTPALLRRSQIRDALEMGLQVLPLLLRTALLEMVWNGAEETAPPYTGQESECLMWRGDTG